MSIHTLTRNDSIKCRVIGHNQNGCFLRIIGIDKSPSVRLFDSFIPIGTIVLASVQKISEHCIKVSLDSVVYLDEADFAA